MNNGFAVVNIGTNRPFNDYLVQEISNGIEEGGGYIRLYSMGFDEDIQFCESGVTVTIYDGTIKLWAQGPGVNNLLDTVMTEELTEGNKLDQLRRIGGNAVRYMKNKWLIFDDHQN